MPIKRESCRVTERTRMRKMHSEGFSVGQISNAVSVRENVVEMVVSGQWAEQENAQKADQKSADAAKVQAAKQEKIDDAAAIAAATAKAIRAAESEELSPQQRGAITRKANAAKLSEVTPEVNEDGNTQQHAN